MAKQHVLPPVLGTVHATRRTPWVAILFTTTIAFGLILYVTAFANEKAISVLGGTTSLLLLAVFAVVNVAVLVLRRDVQATGGHFTTPSWLQGATVYEIFPDRFRNGDVGRLRVGRRLRGTRADRLLVGRDHHGHVAPVLLRRRLDGTQLGHVLGEALQQPEPQLRTGLLASAEHDGDLDLVATLEEAHDVALLGLVVMGVDLGAELLLLDRGQLLVPAGLPGLLRALVLELAVVHELADRGAGLGRDLDEVELGLLGEPQGVLDTHDADLLAVRSDEPDLRHANPVVDAWLDAD
jgi:hypothetical protein